MALNGPDDPRHGTLNGYSNHKCRCEACRTVWRDYCFDNKAKRAAIADRNPRMVPHGTAGGYGNWGCRCDICTAAWAKDCREREARKRAKQMANIRDSIDLINALTKR